MVDSQHGPTAPRQAKRAIVAGLLTAFVAGLGACSQPTATEPPTPVPTIQTGALECETLGYPCALSEVPEGIAVRTDQLGAEALTQIMEGASSEEAATWLLDQDGMAEVDWDEDAIRFRLDGGRGMWIMRSSALATRRASGAAAGAERESGRRTSSIARPRRDERAGTSDHVVRPGVPEKRALVLSPMRWDFRGTDDGREVAGLLEATRGYEGRVVYKENFATYDTDVDVADFLDWDQYDVVHVASHGVRICKKEVVGPCRAAVAAKAIRGPHPDGPEYDVGYLQTLNARGLELALAEPPVEAVAEPTAAPTVEPDAPSGLGKLCRGRAAEIPDCTLVKFLLLTADLFRGAYPSGLTDTFVFLNACETFGMEGTDLADVLRGSTSIYLGWTQPVDSPVAYNTAVLLYTDLQRGYPLQTAYQRLGEVTLEGADSRLNFGRRRSDGDLRIREVVTLLDPESGTPIGSGASVTIRGELDDGEDDVMPYRVWVDGMPDDVAGDVGLHLSVDGREIDPVTVDAAPIDPFGRREITGDAELGEDLTEARLADVRAWVDLPFGGQSEHRADIRLGGPGPETGLIWELDVDYSQMPRFGGVKPIESSAHLIFEHDPDAYEGPGRVIYTVTGGTVRHDESHEDRMCIVTADVISMDVTPEMAEFSILRFDTRTQPYGVVLTVDIYLPEFTSMVACLPGTGEDAGPRRSPEPNRESGHLNLLGMTANKKLTLAPGQTTISGQDTYSTFTLTRVR